jgi:hypothetical protein
VPVKKAIYAIENNWEQLKENLLRLIMALICQNYQRQQDCLQPAGFTSFCYKRAYPFTLFP